jgi:type I restriction enzyme R subunit
MRDVKSRNYFEQMKGRGTRVVDADALKKVSPSALAKTHYVIIDAVGVTKSLKTASQPLDSKPSIPFKDLAYGLMMGDRSEETVSSLASRLSRLDTKLDATDQAQITQMAGRPLAGIIRDLFDAIDADKVEADAKAAGHPEPDDAAMNTAREARIKHAANLFTGPLINLIDTIRRDHEQTIDHDSKDKLLRAEWAGDVTENAQKITQDFATYLTDNRDQVAALTIYFNTPARRSEVSFAMVKDLLHRLNTDQPRLAPLTVWRAYAHLDGYKGDNPASDLTALVALVRRVTGLDDKLTRHSDRVRRNFQNWILKRHSGAGEKFTEAQMDWLRMIRDHLATSFIIEADDLDMAPFDGKGGMGQMYALFGEGTQGVMTEMNEALSA